MSFKFNWTACREEEFGVRLEGLLTDALRKSTKPSIIIDDIVVKDLFLGDETPKLEILDIGDVADDRFRGIFKLNYKGNASITLATTVEANPLRLVQQEISSFACPSMIAANNSLPMPLNLSLSEIQLSGIIILVFSRAKGLTLVFRNDPLENIKVSSSLDTIPLIAQFLQEQIEKVIRNMFREQLPGILHRLSQRYTPEGASSPRVDNTTPSSLTHTKPVSLSEIQPDITEISLSNMLKLETMFASQRTLNIFTPSIPDAVYRSNFNVFDKAPAGYIADESIGSDIADIFRAYDLKSTRKIKPKKRLLKIKLSRTSPVETEAQVTEDKVQNSKNQSVNVSKVERPMKASTVHEKRSMETIKEAFPKSSSRKSEKYAIHTELQRKSSELHELAKATSRPSSPVQIKMNKLAPIIEKQDLTPTVTVISEAANRMETKDDLKRQEFFKNFFSSNIIQDVTPPGDGPPPAYVA